MTAICYKEKTPTVYNKGTIYETSCDTFLAYYTYKSLEEGQKDAERINREKPEKLWNGSPALCDERTYYAIDQPPMESR